MPILQRHKPRPVPIPRTVPENLAAGELAAAYASTKAAFGVPWMGVVAMAFASFPGFYRALWGLYDPIVRSTAFRSACTELRDCAEREAARLDQAPLARDLEKAGYTDADLAAIRKVIEVFAAGNMPYLLMATSARLLLEGHEVGEASPGDLTQAGAPPVLWPAGQALTLVEPHHQDASGRALYEDIKATLGLPFLNTDYRALARWPSYFHLAWQGLQPQVGQPLYSEIVTAVHDRATELAMALPNPNDVRSETVRAAAAAEGASGEVLAVVHLFQWLLPGLVTNVAVFQGQLEN
ncbi:hypothetical protein [Profundibacterium mesophilum]|uniref:Alkylhydroperoxidase AhpD core n=1 Tax=Profundibacterium mesophilum KAUST100406-0324 TaxID=1037889 RepID=A0A921TDR8_9RHOB|nr:hypothetical protein [Profundibacterium mesophilum]KAF0677113.1 Alkylhydroperoxidase AhpD core [Profundibacterium mesophilum KAUST100406-0324]